MLSLSSVEYLTRATEYALILVRNLHIGLVAGMLAVVLFAWRSRVVFLCLLITSYLFQASIQLFKTAFVLNNLKCSLCQFTFYIFYLHICFWIIASNRLRELCGTVFPESA